MTPNTSGTRTVVSRLRRPTGDSQSPPNSCAVALAAVEGEEELLSAANEKSARSVAFAMTAINSRTFN